MKNLKRSIMFQNILIAFLIVFALINLAIIIVNPSNIRSYGWIFVSTCFIISNLINRKENIKKLRNN